MTGDEQAAEYADWLDGLTATPPLNEFRRWSRYDPNLVWRLKSGDLVNLLEDAIDQLDTQNATHEAAVRVYLDETTSTHEHTVRELAELASRIAAIHQVVERQHWMPAGVLRSEIRAILDRPFPKKG